ncbi:MAG: outer membrane beta-barrel protein, partial [Candidatus Methanoperedens sp.]|nr:outer membrane beta-barrel protein [Candidatus Methanoperedens sp.]
TGNTNITRSIAFLNAIPFTHTGARFAFAPTDTLTLYAGLNNGWDQQKDQNKGVAHAFPSIFLCASCFLLCDFLLGFCLWSCFRTNICLKYINSRFCIYTAIFPSWIIYNIFNRELLRS